MGMCIDLVARLDIQDKRLDLLGMLKQGCKICLGI